MEEDISIINSNTRIEKIKNFFVNNKKTLISIFVFLIIILISFFSYKTYEDGHREWLANKYSKAVNDYKNGDKSEVISSMKEVIEDKDETYSPLAFYFLFDNELITSKEEINNYFDLIINNAGLKEENKELNIFKKGLYNSDFASENELLNILNPLLNSESVWKSHALYLLAEYFYSKGEKKKSKEFFDKIINLEISNQNIKLEAQKRIRRDFSE